MPLWPGLDGRAVGHVLCIAGPSCLFPSPHPYCALVVVPTHQKLPPSLISRATALVVVGLCKKSISRFIPDIQIRIWEKFDIGIQYIWVQGELCAVRCGRVMVRVGVATTCPGQVMHVQQRFQAEATMCADAVET